ncbi:xanthine dehydrogenase accessory protein XdhC [Agarivorans sp. DSG3-1]|uniref:xanthine dehydrogenase accessory protein XdhC n=1 Tax=Agarivorans sp. DSG3-1 TaxID=3342249 RepID=UPI00398EDF20
MHNWNQSLQPHNWLDACGYLKEQQQAYCIATVIAEAGSTPRANGAKMVISQQQQFDTLGGGNLEYQVIKHARDHLQHGQNGTQIERFSLAADLAQCCGGAVQVLFEYFAVKQAHITIYGAGHVSHALCQILSQLPFSLEVIDNRQDWLDSIAKLGVNTHYHPEPVQTISELKPASNVLIISQDHSLDFELSLAALTRQDLHFVGVIGSATKAQRFKYRLAEKLAKPELSEQLVCPIGLPEVKGKLPMQVAVSVSAQLISLLHNDHSNADQPILNDTKRNQHKQQWQTVNSLRKQLAGESNEQ